MMVAYKKGGGVVMKFEPNELPEALIFVDALAASTDSKDVQNVADKIRLDLTIAETYVEEGVHICSSCCTPIYPRQIAQEDDYGGHKHVICPKLKPESERDIN